ncbi:MAG: hypothetical protein A2V77_03395 [Anaeromyxobacter sp. RBG_16_69_14]|nr:MAG: hypothetical protein A2V77_03395 [Anaeromyxobacter sp. RBG_16_69_14]
MKLSDFADLRWKDLRKMDRDDALRRIGLERNTPMTDFFGGLGLFAVGLLVGAGLGIIFAPKPGVEMRSQLGDRFRRSGRRAEEYAQRLEAEAASVPGSH